MKTTKTAVVLSVLLITAMAAESAFAWGRGRGHHFFGAPFVAGALVGGALVAGYPYYYPRYAPYYYPPYYPAPVVIQQQPTVYVEQNPQPAPSAQQSAPANYWYYCAGSRAYYPYVRDCPAGWQRVAPQPG